MKIMYKCGYQITNQGEAETYSQQKIEVIFFEFPITKETPQSYWIDAAKWDYKLSKKLVLKDGSGKRFAYLKKEDALRGFLHKRLSYGARLRSGLKNNERLIGLINEEQLKLSDNAKQGS